VETIEGQVKIMTWLVTGASGQLGSALSRQLTLSGIDFVALDSKQLDITNALQVNEAISSYKPYVIVNAAAWTDVDGAETNRDTVFAVNAQGVENLAIAARNKNSIFLHVSTDYVFSGESNQPWLENSPLNPQNIYGQSKSAGELAIRKIYPERSYIVRSAWLYSEYGKNFVRTMCRLALTSDKEVRVVGDQTGQPTNAHDLAFQIILLVNAGVKYGTYHGTNSGNATWFELAQEIFSLSGAEVNRVLQVRSSEYPTAAKRPVYSVLGHKAWSDSGLPAMQDWKIALRKALPAILDSIKMQR